MNGPEPAGFAAACRALGATAPAAVAEQAARDLLARYGASDRGYHDLLHLAEVLERLGELDAVSGALVTAAWFHDAVYRGRPGQDERDSAELATAVLGRLGAARPVAARVADLVLVTADHVPPAGDDAAALLCDADLAVLAADPQRYAAYLAGVRREYAHLDDVTFRAGRTAVLRGLVDRPTLFSSARGRDLWEAAGRRNVTAELGRLTA